MPLGGFPRKRPRRSRPERPSQVLTRQALRLNSIFAGAGVRQRIGAPRSMRCTRRGIHRAQSRFSRRRRDWGASYSAGHASAHRGAQASCLAAACRSGSCSDWKLSTYAAPTRGWIITRFAHGGDSAAEHSAAEVQPPTLSTAGSGFEPQGPGSRLCRIT